MVKQADSLEGLVTHPGTNDAARILKAWRRRERLSQATAAARLGVSVRTLQGWELGRPMPHPGLLQISTTMSRPADPFTLGQSEFPREFARFVDFVGANEMINALRRADTKLGSLLPSTRGLYGDRFYFHEQFIRFSEGSAPYQLDISDAIAVRAASLIAGINRVRDSLSRTGASRLQKTIIGNLRPDRDIRQLEHEIRCVAHFGRKGFKVTFADLEGQGRFDLVVEIPSGPIELECKTISEDTGSQIKLEMTVNLMDAFIRDAPALLNTDKSGIFALTLKRPASECKKFVPRFKAELRCVEQGFERNDFELTFLPRPQWTELLHREQTDELRQAISLDSELAGHAHCFTKAADIFISYTSSDRYWAYWIAKELETLGHTPHVHEWEVNAGDDIYKWMENACLCGRPCAVRHLRRVPESSVFQARTQCGAVAGRRQTPRICPARCGQAMHNARPG